jgi:gas vesicle protein
MKGGVETMDDRDRFIKGVFVGSLIGAILGAVAGILFAPKSGAKIREEIAEKSEELSRRLQKEYETAMEKGRNSFDTITRRLKELEVIVKKKAEELSEKITD